MCGGWWCTVLFTTVALDRDRVSETGPTQMHKIVEIKQESFASCMNVVYNNFLACMFFVLSEGP